MRRFCISLIVFISVFLIATLSFGKTIKIGGIIDTSGGTSDVGKEYAIAVEEAFNWINDHGGINGKKIEYMWFDYGYRIPEAITKYKLLKRWGAIAILGWGTGDTEALMGSVNKDKIPYISASYSGFLADPKRTKYNFFFASDYSTNARCLLTAWYEKRWKKNPDYGKRRPRLALAYMFASRYGQDPIKAIKDHAKLLGIDVVAEVDIPLFAIDTKSQIMELKKAKPDVVWHGNTVMSVAATLRDAYTLGLKADWIINNWGFGEKLPILAGEAAEGVYGATPCALFGQKVKNMDMVIAAAKRYNPGIPLKQRTIRSIQGWCAVMVLWEALKRADKAGNLTGEGIKQALETFRNVDIGLGASPITYTPEDHRPATGCLIQTYKNGKFVPVMRVDLKKRWPDKWKSWLGW